MPLPCSGPVRGEGARLSLLGAAILRASSRERGTPGDADRLLDAVLGRQPQPPRPAQPASAERSAATES